MTLTVWLFRRLFPDVYDRLIDVEHRLELHMTTVDDYVAQQEQTNARFAKAIGDIRNDVTVLVGQVEDLRAHQGDLSPEGQSKLNTVAATSANLADALEAAANIFKAPVVETPPADEPPVVEDPVVGEVDPTTLVDVPATSSRRRR